MAHYLIPARYWDDYSDRAPVDHASEMAEEVRRVGRRVLIRADLIQLSRIRDDAELYAAGNVDDSAALVRSAKAALVAIGVTA